ncbi:MAG: ATP:cob(I)alamin adenosyltransferase [Chloroflexota bacterium]
MRLKEAQGLANPEVLRYLNRLADLVFTLARYEESQWPSPRL